ncbi:MAG: Crp/Fnr family transcriptional regulator [Ferruginibacter sp.]
MENLKKYISELTELSEQSWETLLDSTTEIELKKGEKLLEENKICTSIFFISSGLCKSVFNNHGKEINTAFYFENDFATNIKSLTTSSKSEYSIMACEKSKVIKFEKDKLIEAYKKSHQVETFGRKILELIITKQEEDSNSFKLLTPRQRFDNLILKRPEFLQRISLTQIASYLGISRETLSRFRSIK